jgi:hypothetical protein
VALEREPVIPDAAYARMEAKNRARVGVVPEPGSPPARSPEAATAQPTASPSRPDEDWSS